MHFTANAGLLLWQRAALPLTAKLIFRPLMYGTIFASKQLQATPTMKGSNHAADTGTPK
jgi:hypothetical protein